MQRVMIVNTTEQQTFAGTVLISGVPTPGSSLFLQTFAHPGIMIGPVLDLFASMERWSSLSSAGYGKVANSNSNPNDLRLLLWGWVGLLHFIGNQQKILFVGFVVPYTFFLFVQTKEVKIVLVCRELSAGSLSFFPGLKARGF